MQSKLAVFFGGLLITILLFLSIPNSSLAQQCPTCDVGGCLTRASDLHTLDVNACTYSLTQCEQRNSNIWLCNIFGWSCEDCKTPSDSCFTKAKSAYDEKLAVCNQKRDACLEQCSNSPTTPNCPDENLGTEKVIEYTNEDGKHQTWCTGKQSSCIDGTGESIDYTCEPGATTWTTD